MTTQTRGRPREFDEDEALDAALELFWRNGYRSTTTRELERELGLSQSTLYNAFGSKPELLVSAIDRYTERVDDAVVGPLRSAPDLGGIVAFFEDLTDWVTGENRHGCMVINLIAEDDGGNPELTRRTSDYRSGVRSALRHALDRAAASGETSEDEVDVRADLLFALVLALNVAARGGRSSEVDAVRRSAIAEIESWRRA